MTVVSLELLKKHVRADDFEEDDKLLEHYLKTAEAAVITETRRTVAELESLGGGEFPQALTQAVLMLAGHWYNQREAAGAVQMHEVPYSLQSLIKPYRRLVKDASREDEIPS